MREHVCSHGDGRGGNHIIMRKHVLMNLVVYEKACL